MGFDSRGPGLRLTGWIVVSTVLVTLCLSATLAMAADGYADGARAFARNDYAAARGAWAPLAEANDPRAQYGLGLLYSNGWGIERDALRAQHWYTMASERGHPGAQYNLAVMRDTGNGVPRDSAQAAFWYTEAASQGLPSAAYNLALMTLAGDGLKREPAKAVAWLDRARPMDRARLIAALPTAAVAVRAANIRATPASDAEIVGSARRGAQLRVFARQGDWSEVWQHAADGGPDVIGWVASRLLTGLPAAGAAPVRLDRFEFGALTGLNARRARRPESRTVSTTTSGSMDANTQSGRLLRNSGWLVGIDNIDLGERRGSTVRVATDRLNVRAAPSTGAPVLMQLGHDDTVQVIGRRSGWRRILLPNRAGSGWVAAFLLGDHQPPPGEHLPGRAARIGARDVNLRAGPSMAEQVLGQLTRGEAVRVIDENRGWREVMVPGTSRTGWVAAFLIAGETAAPVATADNARAGDPVGQSGG